MFFANTLDYFSIEWEVDFTSQNLFFFKKSLLNYVFMWVHRVGGSRECVGAWLHGWRRVKKLGEFSGSREFIKFWLASINFWRGYRFWRECEILLGSKTLRWSEFLCTNLNQCRITQVFVYSRKCLFPKINTAKYWLYVLALSVVIIFKAHWYVMFPSIVFKSLLGNRLDFKVLAICGISLLLKR